MRPRPAAGLRRLAAACCLAAAAAASAAASPLTDGLDAYEEGRYDTARALLQAAADDGSPAGQFFLGIMYAKAHGVARDRVAALMWLGLSAGSGFAMARRAHDDLAAAMTPAERAAAAGRARAWRPAAPRRDE
ncbi:MAG: hypothetical protein AB7K86_18605 [Rhodospirillales bacterium]